MTKERPILFSGTMVRAILDGRKAQTRRVVKPQFERAPVDVVDGVPSWDAPTNFGGEEQMNPSHGKPCPHGIPGDHLWVKETIRLAPDQAPDDGTGWVLSLYAADGAPTVADAWPWKRLQLNSIHCPRGLSRILLEVTGVRVERLNDCSEADAIAEGIAPEQEGWTDYSNPSCQMCPDPVDSYRTLWDSINGAGAWEANPWVWVVEFRRIEA